MKSLTIVLATLLLPWSGTRADEALADPQELHTGKEFKKAFANPTDDPALPRVLLIGDSISIGYTIPVRKRLAGKANVHRIPTNGQTVAFGVRHLPQWLGGKKWDVIHFNWGLWDVCYRNPESKTQGHRDKIHGTIATTPEQYESLLEEAVVLLKKTGARLIWCATTPVPPNEAGRIQGDEVAYNLIARKVMLRHGIAINDLHAHVLPKITDLQINHRDVHFTKGGYDFLAQKVAADISVLLQTPAPGTD